MKIAVSIGFLALVGLVIPAMAWYSKKKLDEGLVVPRLPFYAESAAVQLLLLPIALAVAWVHDAPMRFGANVNLATCGAAAGMLAASLVIMAVAWNRTDPYRRERLLAIVPATSREKVAWCGVSLVAGVCEEVLYRGALYAVLITLGFAFWAAIPIAAALFGLAHLVQGWKSSLVVMVFGALFQLLVLFSGGLGLAIAVHAAYDLAVGLTLGGTRSIAMEAERS